MKEIANSMGGFYWIEIKDERIEFHTALHKLMTVVLNNNNSIKFNIIFCYCAMGT